MLIRTPLALALCCAVPPFALADDGDAPRSPPIETVVVIAHPLSAEGLALAADVLEGDELAAKLASSIGETVGYQPGVHSANYGQAASRPVIHGLSGPRVRILEDRIDSLDVSVTSADHAVTIEPFLADRIEILKGPSTLLYGSGAIGGVVDVHTGRIPHDRATQPLTGRLEGRRSNNSDRETVVGRLDGGVGAFAWHLDGFSRKADEYRFPGVAESRALRELEDDQDDDDAEVRRRLPGSDMDSKGGAVGFSFIGDRGFAGIAISGTDATYGLPGLHAHEHHDEDEEDEDGEVTPYLDLKQTRIDLEAGLANPFRGFEAINVRVGFNDYEHQEIEPDGDVATLFENEAWEARVELLHEEVAGWRGAFGIQYTNRDFSAVGEEAFIAPVETRAIGVFWVGERRFESFELEAGLRLETVDVDSSTEGSEDFTSYAASLGVVVPLADGWSLGLLSDYSARAPIAEELFSHGPHLTTGTFEIGNPDLDEERALSLSANLRYVSDDWLFNSTLYYTRFSDFIYEAPTGDEEDGLPVFVYRQAGADFVGFDAEARRTVATWDQGRLEVTAQFDTVAASLDIPGNDNVPRLPATRYGLGLAGHWSMMRASLDHLWVAKQNDVADFELRTDRYRDLRAQVAADFGLGRDANFSVFVQGRNLTNEEQRQHTSFIKDFAPMPGRTIEAGVRASF
jgi:iron complex outermembrane recepter protein